MAARNHPTIYHPRDQDADDDMATLFCAAIPLIRAEWEKPRPPGKVQQQVQAILVKVAGALDERGVLGTHTDTTTLDFKALANSTDTIVGLTEVLRYMDAGGAPMTDTLARVQEVMRSHPELVFDKLQKGLQDIGRSQTEFKEIKRHGRNSGTYPLLMYDTHNPLRTEDGRKFGKKWPAESRALKTARQQEDDDDGNDGDDGDDGDDEDDGPVRPRPLPGKRFTGPLPALIRDQVDPYRRLLKLVATHTASAGEALSAPGSVQDHQAFVAQADVLTLHTVMTLVPSRTCEVCEDSSAAMAYVRVRGSDGSLEAVPFLARSIDLTMGTLIDLDDTMEMIIEMLVSNGKPRGIKQVNHVPTRRFELPNALRGLTTGMLELCLALTHAVGKSHLLLIGRDTSNMCQAVRKGGCSMTPYGSRNRHAIEAKMFIERLIIKIEDAIRLFGHRNINMIERVYAEFRNTEVVRYAEGGQFADTAHTEVPDRRLKKRRCLAELAENELHESRAYPRDRFATEPAIKLALFATRRMIAEWTALGATVDSLISGGRAKAREIVHAMVARDAAPIYDTIYGRATYSPEETAELSSAIDALRPTHWSQLRTMIERAPALVDVGKADFGATPQEVVAAIGSTFVSPPPFVR